VVLWLLMMLVPELRKVDNRSEAIMAIRASKPNLAKVVFLSLPQVLGNVGIDVAATATAAATQTVGMGESQRMCRKRKVVEFFAMSVL